MSKTITKETFQAFCSGNEDVFKMIMQENYSVVFGYIRKLIQSKMDAEELTQDVFIKLWESHSTVKSHQSFYSFLFTIARNIALNFLAKNAPNTVEFSESLNLSEFSHDSSSILVAKELELLILMVTQEMPEQRRRVFEMSRFENKSMDEIAQELGIAKSTGFNLLGVALRQMKEAISVLIVITIWIYS